MRKKSVSRATVAIALCLAWAPPAEAQLGNLLGSKTAAAEISAAQVRKLQTEFAAAVKSAQQSDNAKPDPSFVIVDVRSEPEYEVSVIPGAITAKQYEQNRDLYKGQHRDHLLHLGISQRTVRQETDRRRGDREEFQGKHSWLVRGDVPS